MRINKIALGLLLGGLMANNSVLANHNYNKDLDNRIKESLDKTMDKYPNIDHDVNVKVKDACVTLTGKVDNKAEEQQAVQLASGINGVREVEDKLEIATR